MNLIALSIPLSIPSPSQGVWHLGPFPIRAYALAIILGVVAAVWVGEQALGGPRRHGRARSATSRSGRCRSAWSAAGSTTWPPTTTSTSAPASTPVDAL